jgi:hypothetical protein
MEEEEAGLEEPQREVVRSRPGTRGWSEDPLDSNSDNVTKQEVNILREFTKQELKALREFWDNHEREHKATERCHKYFMQCSVRLMAFGIRFIFASGISCSCSVPYSSSPSPLLLPSPLSPSSRFSAAGFSSILLPWTWLS